MSVNNDAKIFKQLSKNLKLCQLRHCRIIEPLVTQIGRPPWPSSVRKYKEQSVINEDAIMKQQCKEEEALTFKNKVTKKLKLRDHFKSPRFFQRANTDNLAMSNLIKLLI